KARRRLMDRPAEIHPGDRRALPERGLRGKLVAADRGYAEIRQIEDRARETGRGDHVVDLEDQLGGALGLARVHAEEAAASLDPLDRCVEDDHAACQNMVLVRLHVPRADADERARVDRELRRRWRREDDLLRPLQETGGELEAGVLLADDEDAPPGIRFGRPGL